VSLSRRRFLFGVATMLGAPACARLPARTAPAIVNDIHSRLNATDVARVERPDSAGRLSALIRRARDDGHAVSIAGGRHAMGGQQFGQGTVLLDMRRMARVVSLDAERGLVTVEAGIQWPALVDHLVRVQNGRLRQWGIVQKQTGADRLTIGGALAANVHGRGLAFPPFVADVESFTLMDGRGLVRRCSRQQNAELFGLAIGGYGLLGVVSEVTLRLAPRRKIQRVVEVVGTDGLAERFDRRIREGFVYGDCQYATDPASDDFLRRGVFSCYRPVDDRTPIDAGQKELSLADWDRLLLLSHADKRRAFDAYAAYYLSTSGQVYWSDTHQLSVYVDDYHVELDRRLGATAPGTEIITEAYVPRARLSAFLEDIRRDFRQHDVDLIYGTIRLIEQDRETVLAWAREPWACVIFNLHAVHTPVGLARVADDLRRVIDIAASHGGSYFLTYHRHARREQVERCHPRLVEFLRAKRRHDPDDTFQSEWYRHYRTMFGDAL